MKMGIWELLIVLVIVILIFGPKALPKLGKSMGKTIGNFKKGLNEDGDDDDDDEPKVRKAEAGESADADGEKKSYDPER